jgi:hypothetical protein
VQAESKEVHGTVSKRPYSPPMLTKYGDVRSLTRSGSGTQAENASNSCDGVHKPGNATCSDPRLKENALRIGDHPMGFGLYLFDYKPQYKAEHGESRQFGVMADEILQYMPSAVITREDGFLAVDYGLLGIVRALH